MTYQPDVKVFIAQTEDGEWIAATAASPFFYFVGESERSVIDKSKRAYSFYCSSLGLIEEKIEIRERAARVPRLKGSRTLSAEELLCA